MLGRQIIPDERGKLIGMRVLPSEGQGPRIEFTFQSSGTVLGVPFTNTGTVVSIARPGGTLHSDGQGIAMTEDGEAVAWTFHGIGIPPGPGLASRIRGIVRFETGSQRLAELNQLCAVVEGETDTEQRMIAQLWEWR